MTRGWPDDSRPGIGLLSALILCYRHLIYLCISVITQAELLFGLARRPQSKSLHALVHAFLTHIEVLPWSSDTAASYGKLRATLEKQGWCPGVPDMLIAAHAVSEQAVLVTNDRAFTQLPQLVVEDWSA